MDSGFCPVLKGLSARVIVKTSCSEWIYPNIAYPRRGKTRQSARDVGARRLGQDEQYLTVREILSEASTLADGELSRERSDFYRFEYATLGFTLLSQSTSFQRQSQICDGPFPTRCGVLCFLHIF